jgi:hypothetical protein
MEVKLQQIKRPKSYREKEGKEEQEEEKQSL